MTVRVGFLRAVNLGKRKVEMARLKAVAEGLGYDDVWTYINSGNVVFDAKGARATVEKSLEKALEDEFGFECTTFVRTAAELEKTLAATPFDVGCRRHPLRHVPQEGAVRQRGQGHRGHSPPTSTRSSSRAPTCTG